MKKTNNNQKKLNIERLVNENESLIIDQQFVNKFKHFYMNKDEKKDIWIKNFLLLENVLGLDIIFKISGKKAFLELIKSSLENSLVLKLSSLSNKLNKFFKQKKFNEINKSLNDCKKRDLGDLLPKDFKEFRNKVLKESADGGIIPPLKMIDFFSNYFTGLFSNDKKQQVDNFSDIISGFCEDNQKNILPMSVWYYVSNTYRIVSQSSNLLKFTNNIISFLTKEGKWFELINFYINETFYSEKELDDTKAFFFADKAYSLLIENPEIVQKISPEHTVKAYYNFFLIIKKYNNLKALECLKQVHKIFPDNKMVETALNDHIKTSENNKRIYEGYFGGNSFIKKKLVTSYTVHKLSEENSTEVIPTLGKTLLEELTAFIENDHQCKMSAFEKMMEIFKNNPKLSKIKSLEMQYIFFILSSSNNKYGLAFGALKEIVNVIKFIPVKYQCAKSQSVILLFDAIKIIICDDYVRNNFMYSTEIFNTLSDQKISEKIKYYLNFLLELKNLAVKARSIRTELEIEESKKQKKGFKKEKETDEIIKLCKTVKNKQKVSSVTKRSEELKVKQEPIKEKKPLSYKEIEIFVKSGNWHLLDPRSINKYFASTKKQAINQTLKNSVKIKKNNENTIWKLPKNTYSITPNDDEDNCIKVTKITKFQNVSGEADFLTKNYYVAISPKIARKLDTEQLRELQEALPTNLKFIKVDEGHQNIELWNKNELRLITRKIYRKEGKLLIVFDKKANHTGVKASLNPLKMIDLDIANIAYDNLSNLSGENNDDMSEN